MELIDIKFDDSRLRELIERLKTQPEHFPRVAEEVRRWGESAVEQWIKLVDKHGPTLGQPGFWRRGYLGNGNRNIKWSHSRGNPLNVEVYHDNGGAEIDFGNVIEFGRRSYDFRNILRTSSKVRQSAKGVRYIVIPLPTKDTDGGEDFTMTKTGETRGAGGNLNNEYEYSRNTPGNIAGFRQQQRNGVHKTKAALVTLSENSRWRPYPEIRGYRYSKVVSDHIEQGQAKLESPEGPLEFNQSIARAAALDLVEVLKK